MDRAIVLHLPLTVLLLALFPSAKTTLLQHRPLPSPRGTPPLCASQFELVNRACSQLPFRVSPGPSPPSPSSPDDEEHNHHHHRGRHHHNRHHHGHKHRHRESLAELDCCRWLKEVDNVCVCDVLVLLPPFLTIPLHDYTVTVDETCAVTFACGSRFVRG